MKFHFLVFLFFTTNLFGQQFDTLFLDSKILGKTIQIYLFNPYPSYEVPTYYFTDGKKVIGNGMARLIDSLGQEQEIAKGKYVFVSTIDPHTQEEFRNEYFFCNPDYLRFFEKELIPIVEGAGQMAKERYLVGVSFGALNAAYFAATSKAFAGYALLSPITYPCEHLPEEIVFSTNKDYKLYVSTGEYDAENYIERIVPLLRQKTKELQLVKTKGGHDFTNWNQQLKVVLNFLNN